jgi:signal transduction histidine kinase
MRRLRVRRFRDLPLIAQLLLPFLALMLFVGGFGVLVIVHDLSERGKTALEQDLSRRLLEARSTVRDHELYLVESANFASNVEGIASRLRANDRDGVERLVRSVLALKTDLTLLAITTANGRGLLQFSRTGSAWSSSSPEVPWQAIPFVTDVLNGRSAAKTSGFVTFHGRTILAIAAPVCPGSGACLPLGAAIVGLDLDALVTDVLASSAGSASSRGVAIFDGDGRLIARSGTAIERALPGAAGDSIAQKTRVIDGVEEATAYAPFEMQGRRAGTLAVTVPTAPAFATARGAATKLALVVVAVMAGVVALGGLLSRSILGQVKPLVATNRALALGDLNARAVVLGEGELGELASGVNHMAEQIQAMYNDLELRVEQRTAEVRRLLKERTEFFASISHELRTPLAVILGQGKMLADPKYPKNRPWTTNAGHTIVETTSQLIAVVNEILELARADAGRLEISLETVDVEALLKELTPTFEDVARSGHLHLSVVRPMERPAVRADRRRLATVLLNLIDNAVKYTPAGGSVTLAVSADKNGVEFSVTDTGIGISPEAGDLIFEPFFRVQGANAQGGQASSGLGLALAKRLVEAQGGTIGYTSEPGQGTTFAVTLARVANKSERAGTRKARAVALG